MSRSYRIIILALGLVLAGHHPHAKAQPQQAEAQERSAKALENISALYNEQAKRSESTPESSPCRPGDDQRNSDLCAQWKAADAAADSAWWAAVGGFASAVSTVLVLFALHLAFRSNLIARDAANRQLRAYVGVESLKFEITSSAQGYKPIDFSLPGTVYTDFITVNVHNFGQTPASKVTSRVQVMVVPFLGSLPDDFPDESGFVQRGNNIETRHYLQAGKSEAIKSGLPDISPYWAAMGKQCSIFIAGRIFYEDAFGQSRSTKFAYTWEPWHPPGERFVPINRYNGEDDCRDPSSPEIIRLFSWRTLQKIYQGDHS